MPAPGEYVARGAARQAAWVDSGAAEPPSWGLAVEELPASDPHPEVVEAYRAVRPWGQEPDA
jgi:xylulokinase